MGQTEISNYGSSFDLLTPPPPLPPIPKKHKNQNFEKNEKNCWRYHHFTRVPKTTITWGTAPEIRRETDTNFCHFCRFTLLTTQKIKFWKNEKHLGCHHFTHVYQKSQSYDVCFLWYGVIQIQIFVILGNFLPFYPTNNPERKHFEKTEKNVYKSVP